MECFVVSFANAESQQKVNKAAPEHPRTCELIWLNRPCRPALRETVPRISVRHERAAEESVARVRLVENERPAISGPFVTDDLVSDA